MKNTRQITKKEFYSMGGFSNPDLYRKQSGKRWNYYHVTDNGIW